MLLELGINHQIHICFTKLYYLVLSVLRSLTGMHVFAHTHTQAHNVLLKKVNPEVWASVRGPQETWQEMFFWYRTLEQSLILCYFS